MDTLVLRAAAEWGLELIHSLGFEPELDTTPGTFWARAWRPRVPFDNIASIAFTDHYVMCLLSEPRRSAFAPHADCWTESLHEWANPGCFDQVEDRLRWCLGRWTEAIGEGRAV